MAVAGSLTYDTSLDTKGFESGLGKIGTAGAKVAKGIGVAVGAVATGLTALVTASVKSYADMEQNLGGVETLFKDSADKVIENAKKAYKTAGLSANEYMQNVTSFSASLLQSVAGDTNKAADIADMAMVDMADNANKMGTSMESIQNAYQGFAKQNYTMLDNLKLGYGGTKTEMERLLKDAEKFSGVKYDINNLSDVYQAIHVIQEELDITGTTSKEASETISGSVSAMKSAFDNFLSGAGGTEELVDATTTAILNITQAIVKMAPQIIQGMVEIINQLLPMIPILISQVLPVILDGAVSIVNGLINLLINNLPMFIQTGMTLLMSLLNGILNAIPQLIPVIVQCVMTIINTILEHLPEIIMAGIDIIVALVLGIIDALPQIIDGILEAIGVLVATLLRPDVLMKIIMAGIQIIVALVIGLIEAIPRIIAALPKILDAMVTAFKNMDWKQIGKNILKGILDGFLNIGNLIWNAVKRVGNAMLSSIKKFFGIASPSKLMRDKVGKFLPQGIAIGITANTDSVDKAIDDMNDGIMARMRRAVSVETGKMGISGISATVNQILTSNQTISGVLSVASVLDGKKVGQGVAPFVTRTVKTAGGV